MRRSVDPNNNENYGVLQKNKPPSLCYTYWLHRDPDNNENYGVLQIDKPPSLGIHILVTHRSRQQCNLWSATEKKPAFFMHSHTGYT